MPQTREPRSRWNWNRSSLTKVRILVQYARSDISWTYRVSAFVVRRTLLLDCLTIYCCDYYLLSYHTCCDVRGRISCFVCIIPTRICFVSQSLLSPRRCSSAKKGGDTSFSREIFSGVYILRFCYRYSIFRSICNLLVRNVGIIYLLSARFISRN